MRDRPRALGAGLVLAAVSRVQILDLLRRAGTTLTVAQVADAVGLHQNTAREHLQTLVDGGFVDRETEVRTTRGRPRALYRYPAPGQGREPGAGLDEALRVRLAEVAIASYAARPPRAAGGDPAWGQLAALEQHFAELGMEPEASPQERHVHLWRCPVRALARDHTAVVCRVHAELARQVLARTPGPLEVDRLEPFVGPEHCVLHLRAVS